MEKKTKIKPRLLTDAHIQALCELENRGVFRDTKVAGFRVRVGVCAMTYIPRTRENFTDGPDRICEYSA